MYKIFDCCRKEWKLDKSKEQNGSDSQNFNNYQNDDSDCIELYGNIDEEEENEIENNRLRRKRKYWEKMRQRKNTVELAAKIEFENCSKNPKKMSYDEGQVEELVNPEEEDCNEDSFEEQVKREPNETTNDLEFLGNANKPDDVIEYDDE